MAADPSGQPADMNQQDAIAPASPRAPPPAQTPPHQPPPAQQQSRDEKGVYRGSQPIPWHQAQQHIPNGAVPPFPDYNQFVANNTPPPELESRSWRIAKMALHGAAILFSIIGLGTALGTKSTPYSDYITIVAPPPFLGLVIIWSGAELIARAIRKWTKGIHPGAHVGVCLILWLAGGLVGGIIAAFSYYSSWDVCYLADSDINEPNDGYDEYGRYVGNDDDDDNCATQWPQWRILILVSATFICLVDLIYLVLFIGACIDTAKVNAHNKRPIMIVAPPYWGHAAQGWQPVPAEQPQQQYGQPIPLSPMPSGFPSSQPAQPRSGDQGVAEYYSPGRS
jgi:hypothetical protein